MSRRNQARRRRSYNRRQHEMRERRDADAPTVGWLLADDAGVEWPATEPGDDRVRHDDGLGDFAR